MALSFTHPPGSIAFAKPACPILYTASIMPARALFLPAAALPSRACSRAQRHVVRLRSAVACKSGSAHRLVQGAVALMVSMAMSAAFGVTVARAQGTDDVYNGATGAWSTAQLSVARSNLAAASVGNVALFAGGATAGAVLCRERGWEMCIVACVFCVMRVLQYCGYVLPCDRFLSHARHCRWCCF